MKWYPGKLSTALLACLGLAACDLAPRYQVPTVPTPKAFAGAPGWLVATPTDDEPRGDWWAIFHDQNLNHIEGAVTDANQDLKAASAHYQQARALARETRSAAFPTLDAATSANRGRLSSVVSNPLPDTYVKDIYPQLDASYELDVWGRIRNSTRAARARAQASAGDFAAASLSLHAEAAIDYFQLRGLDAQSSVLSETVAAYDKALGLTEDRFRAGYAAEPDVSAAQTALQLARTKAADVQLQRANLEHALAILAGQPPENFHIRPILLDATPPGIPSAVPASLLLRRPDVAAAERRAAAANYDIGVARAAFFPTIDLMAAIGTEAQASRALFSAPAETWAVGGTGVLNVFDGGRRRAASAQAHAAFDEAAAQYRQTALEAFGEVEDQLVALQRLSQESESQRAAVDAATRAQMQAQRRYVSGYASYYDVITAQNVALSARLDQADIDARRMTASVSLIKALGGGWKNADTHGVAMAQATPPP